MYGPKHDGFEGQTWSARNLRWIHRPRELSLLLGF